MADNFDDWPKNVKGKFNFHKASAKKKTKNKQTKKKTAAKTAKAVANKSEHCSKRNMSTAARIMKV